MVFLTSWFFIFLVVALSAFWVVPRKLRRYCLLAFSFVFHGHFAGTAGVIPILVLGNLAFVAGLTVRYPRLNKIATWSTIALVVSSLLYFKYVYFLADLIGFSYQGEIFVPLAISFFTFEFVHYLVDVRKTKAPISNLFDFWIFTVFFPTIASGPIKRYQNFIPQLNRIDGFKLDPETALIAFYRIITGLFKKMIIAEWCVSELAKIEIWIGDAALPRIYLVGLVLLQTTRIYMDFSGYSDMAIGVSRLFGITVPENFNWPYLAGSLSDFWKRWHISLSSWIRDYVYIPLGGSRMSLVRKTANGLTAMILCGLWHGPSLHFAVWGIYHGVGLAFQNPIKRMTLILIPEETWLFKTAAWFFTLGFVMLGWLIFFYEWRDLKWILKHFLFLA